MITIEGYKRLPLVKDVNVAVDFFFHDWEIAALKAINTFEADPNYDDHATLQYWLGFVGNMLWAVTLLVQPEVGLAGEALALATKRGLAVQKAGSLIGAAAASGIAGRLLWSNPPATFDTPAAKKQILQQLTILKGLSSASIKALTPRWAMTGDGLLGSLVFEASSYLSKSSADFRSRMAKFYADARKAVPAVPPLTDAWLLLTDDEFLFWYNGNDGGGGDEILKAYVWKTFFDPGKKISYVDRSTGLLNYFIDLFNSVEEQFELQREIYRKMEDDSVDSEAENLHSRGRQMTPSTSMLKGHYEAKYPFKFKPYFGIKA